MIRSISILFDPVSGSQLVFNGEVLSLSLVDILGNASMSLVKADLGVAGADGADGDMINRRSTNSY